LSFKHKLCIDDKPDLRWWLPTASSSDEDTHQLTAYTILVQIEPLTTFLPAAARLVAIGDLHGDMGKTRRAFRIGGLIDHQDRWCGGTTTAVQVLFLKLLHSAGLKLAAGVTQLYACYSVARQCMPEV